MQGGCAIPARLLAAAAAAGAGAAGDVAAKGRGKGKEQACPQYSHSASLPISPSGPVSLGKGRVERGVSRRGQAVPEEGASPYSKGKTGRAGPRSSAVLRSVREIAWAESGSFLPLALLSDLSQKLLPPLFAHSEWLLVFQLFPLPRIPD